MLSVGDHSDDKVQLLSTPGLNHELDPFEGLVLLKSSSRKRRNRYLIIGVSIALWLLVAIIFVADVNRSWLALEHEWTVSIFMTQSTFAESDR